MFLYSCHNIHIHISESTLKPMEFWYSYNNASTPILDRLLLILAYFLAVQGFGFKAFIYGVKITSKKFYWRPAFPQEKNKPLSQHDQI